MLPILLLQFTPTDALFFRHDRFAGHHFIVLALMQRLKDHLEDPLVGFHVITILHIIQPVADAVRIVDVRQQRGSQLIVGHIRFLAFNLLDEHLPVFFLLQHELPNIAAFIAAKLKEVVLQNAPHHVQRGNRGLNVAELVPERGIRVLNGIVVLILAGFLLALPGAQFDAGNVVVLPDHVERGTVIIPGLFVRDFPMEIHVMGQDEQLLDVIAGHLRV